MSAREAAKKFLADMSVNGNDIKRERKKGSGALTIRELCEKYSAAGGSGFIVDMIFTVKPFIDVCASDLNPIDIETWRTAEKKRTENKNITLNKKITP
mgnify:CR=1 FL=1